MPVPDIKSVRILEIGAAGLVARTFPDQTTFFSTGPSCERVRNRDPDRLIDLIRILVRGDYDLVVCRPEARGPFRWQTLSRLVFSRNIWRNLKRPLRLLAPQLLRFFRSKPLAVTDFADPQYIDRDNFYLLDRSLLYFKRELPADDWRAFTKTASPTQPSERLRRNRKFIRRVAKLRPVPLGLPSDFEPLHLPAAAEKTIDVFFAGASKGLLVRERALAELRTLQKEGYVIEVAEGRLPRQQFYQRLASAWLVLSPEGHGWDCFRHYEAAACGSVPLINQPPIRRHAPLVRDRHALFFDVEPGALAATIRTALADKPRLKDMAAAGQAHVLANHTAAAIARHVVEAALAAMVEGERST